VAQLLRTTWRAVSGIVERVVAEAAGATDRLAGLRRIGIDEVAYRKGQRYLTVVVDHDTGALVWAGKGRDKATVAAFFDALGADRAVQLTHVSADAAEWIEAVVAERAPQAIRCMDPYHLVAWGSDALDKVRRQVWNAERGGTGGRTRASVMLKGARWALWKNPERLSEPQRQTLAVIQKTNKPLYRAYLLKEQLREIEARQLPGQRHSDAGLSDTPLPARDRDDLAFGTRDAHWPLTQHICAPACRTSRMRPGTADPTRPAVGTTR
jgi:transposase